MLTHRLLPALFVMAGIVSAQSAVSVINGARFELRYPVAPGSYAQAYGTFSGLPASAQAAPNVAALPTELGGVRVLVNDVAAPIYAIRADVVSFVVPAATPAGRRSVRIERAGVALGAGTVDVLPVSPGIFYAMIDGRPAGGVLNQDSGYAIQTAPARRGTVIQVFGTGQGETETSVADGRAPGAAVRARGATKVFISGQEAELLYSGLSPQFPGLWQINARVPDRPFIAGEVPLVVTIDGVPSNTVTFWVQQ
jgi:uncharacterized protein (TIGR03437 family)